MKKSFLAMCTLLMFATAAQAQERKSKIAVHCGCDVSAGVCRTRCQNFDRSANCYSKCERENSVCRDSTPLCWR